MNKVYYNYRYFLPYAPEWGSEEFCNRRLEELLAFCNEAKVDAVQFFVNTLPGTYYMPARSADEQSHWADWMKSIVAPALKENGISYQLNLQMLLGATTQGLDMRDEYDWEFLVDSDGREALGCACPTGAKFRQAMGGMLRLWADTRPDVIWIDDDFRLHNHGNANGELDFYCYCENHLEQFADYCGRRYSREELVANVLKSGKPSPLRLQWLDFLCETMIECAGWIRKEIHGISPETRLALMTSCPDVHSAEGRDWNKMLTELCGEHPPVTRPCSGIYTGTVVAPCTQSITYRFMAHSIALIEDAFGEGVAQYGPELENTRFTTWCKSSRNTEYVLMLGQLMGCPEITLSISDLDGSPISDEPTNLPLLRENKPRLQALADLDLRKWKQQGIVFISDADIARKVQLSESARMQDLGLLRHWEDPLIQMGIPAYYGTSQQAAESQDVVVLEGYTAWSPTDEQMTKILSGAVLLDGAAAAVLQQRGFGEYIGVTVNGRNDYNLHAEIYNGEILPGLESIRVPNRAGVWHSMEVTDATIVSRFVEPKYSLQPGSAIYENKLGGRVAVYAGRADSDSTFASHARLRWLHGILRWLSRERFCALPVIPHHGLTLMRKLENKTMLAFANLGTDSIKNFKVRLSELPENVKILERQGSWNTSYVKSLGNNEYSFECELEAFEWLAAVYN